MKSSDLFKKKKKREENLQLPMMTGNFQTLHKKTYNIDCDSLIEEETSAEASDHKAGQLTTRFFWALGPEATQQLT